MKKTRAAKKITRQISEKLPLEYRLSIFDKKRMDFIVPLICSFMIHLLIILYAASVNVPQPHEKDLSNVSERFVNLIIKESPITFKKITELKIEKEKPPSLHKPKPIKKITEKKVIEKKISSPKPPEKKSVEKKITQTTVPSEKTINEKITQLKPPQQEIVPKKIPRPKPSPQKTVVKKIPQPKLPPKKTIAKKTIAKKIPQLELPQDKTLAKISPPPELPPQKISSEKSPQQPGTPEEKNKETAPLKKLNIHDLGILGQISSSSEGDNTDASIQELDILSDEITQEGDDLLTQLEEFDVSSESSEVGLVDLDAILQNQEDIAQKKIDGIFDTIEVAAADKIILPEEEKILESLQLEPNKAEIISGPSVDKNRSEEVILKVVSSYKSSIAYCYQRELKDNPDLKGRITVKFSIGKADQVLNAEIYSSEINNANLEACLIDMILRWRFPAGAEAVTTVIYPFIFFPRL
ncbi:MAG: AgmX/PglI C-terminal domain-containing protein [bacterium]